METITGKKETRNLIYTYLDFKFKLHRLGDSTEGKAMYRLSALNFDVKLLKAYTQKNTHLKDACTISLNNPKEDLLNIFNSVIDVKMKKEIARLAYEKAVKEGTLPVKEVEETKEVKDVKKVNPYKKDYFKPKKEYSKTRTDYSKSKNDTSKTKSDNSKGRSDSSNPKKNYSKNRSKSNNFSKNK